MKDRRLLWPLGITAGICWAAWIYFLFIFDVGAIPSAWDPWRIAFYFLLLLAPAITFIPISQWLGWRFFGPYATLGWAAFGYLLAFVRPTAVLLEEAPLLSLWYFFLVLFVVLTTILAPLAHTIGLRLFTSRTHQRDLMRAWREAGLLSLYLVGLAIGRGSGLLNWPIALLSLLFLVLVEALFLARKA
jgi:hypothetical protein